MKKPLPHSKPATRVSFGMISRCQWKWARLGLVEGGRVQHEVVGRLREDAVHAAQEVAQEVGQPAQLVEPRLLEGRPVAGGEDPRLAGKARGKGSEGHETVALRDEPAPGAALLAQDVAPDAALLALVVVGRAVQLLAHHDGDDGRGDELGVRMLERRARRLAVILEDQDVGEARVLLEIERCARGRPSSTSVTSSTDMVASEAS